MATLKTNTISPSTGSALALTATSVTVNGTLAVTGTLNSAGVFTAPTGATIAATTGNLTVGTSAKFQVLSADGSTTCGGVLNLTNTGTTTHKLAAASKFQINPSTGATAIDAPVTINNTLQSTGFITNGFGYAVGSGGAVTQATSRATGVALSKLTGTIQPFNVALAAGSVTTFTLSNTLLAATDLVLINQVGGVVLANYVFSTGTPIAGTSVVICYRNIAAVALGDTVLFKFTVVKAPVT